MKRRVGFIGLGDQGAPMAAALALRHDLHVFARRDAAYAELGPVRFVRARDPQALARSVDILCLCLPGDAELRELLFADGVANALPGGGIVINHATGDPGAAMQIAEALARMGLGYLDAPVSGGAPVRSRGR
ncbi:NAD(P)-binding domain-containing protein [Microvirga antarctica]|uniref:NAD(P)-binding domain-containing protein n=1 Tax=Microvirga antarctica TaxID=2819233 RepID=UPI001B30CC34|nr:NAD(P)-binding domain-containing protein [Microvirga antarctica]